MSASKTSISAAFQRCIGNVITHDPVAKYTAVDFNASEAIYRNLLRTYEKIIGAVTDHVNKGGDWDLATFKLAVHKILCPVSQNHDHSIGCVSDDLYLVYGDDVPLFNNSTQEGQLLMELAENRILSESKKTPKPLSKQEASQLALELSKVGKAIVLAIARQARDLDSKSIVLSEGAVKQVLAIPSNFVYMNDKTVPSLTSPNGDVNQKTTDARSAEETLLTNVTMEKMDPKPNNGDAKFNDSLYKFGNSDEPSMIGNFTMDKQVSIPRDQNLKTAQKSKFVDDWQVEDDFFGEPSVVGNFTMDKDSQSYEPSVVGNFTMDKDSQQSYEPSVVGNFTMDKDSQSYEPSVVGNFTMDKDSQQSYEPSVVGNFTMDKHANDDDSFASDVSFGENSIPDLQQIPSNIRDDKSIPVNNVYEDDEEEEEEEEGEEEDNQGHVMEDVGVDENFDEQLTDDDDDDDEDFRYDTGGTFTDDTDFVPATDFSAMRGNNNDAHSEEHDHNDVEINEDGELVSSGCGCNGNKNGKAGGGVEYYNW